MHMGPLLQDTGHIQKRKRVNHSVETPTRIHSQKGSLHASYRRVAGHNHTVGTYLRSLPRTSCYKKKKGRSHTAEERIGTPSQRPYATSQPYLFSHTQSFPAQPAQPRKPPRTHSAREHVSAQRPPNQRTYYAAENPPQTTVSLCFVRDGSHAVWRTHSRQTLPVQFPSGGRGIRCS